MDTIEALNPKSYHEYLRTYRNTICGRYPIGVLLQAVKELQARHSFALRFVRYAQSNRCVSSRDTSVSYASASLVLTDNYSQGASKFENR